MQCHVCLNCKCLNFYMHANLCWGYFYCKKIPIFSCYVWKQRLSKWQEKVLNLYRTALGLDSLFINKMSAFYNLINCLWFVSLSFLWLLDDVNDSVWFMCSDILDHIYYILYIENASTPSTESLLCIFWSRWKLSWEARKAVWHCASCSPSDRVKGHSVTLLVFLSTDSSP